MGLHEQVAIPHQGVFLQRVLSAPSLRPREMATIPTPLVQDPGLSPEMHSFILAALSPVNGTAWWLDVVPVSSCKRSWEKLEFLKYRRCTVSKGQVSLPIANKL